MNVWKVKVERGSTFTFTRGLPYIAFISFMRVNFVRLHRKITRQWKLTLRMLRASCYYPCTHTHTRRHISRAFSRVSSPVFGFQLIVGSGPFFKG